MILKQCQITIWDHILQGMYGIYEVLFLEIFPIRYFGVKLLFSYYLKYIRTPCISLIYNQGSLLPAPVRQML